ncbi:MAG: DUF4190 domain-containing protein [Thermoplasmatota archaeon]
MDDEKWDPKPPHGTGGGYDKYPGYSRVTGDGASPRQVPPLGQQPGSTSPGYDFNRISNSPLYSQSSPYPPPYGAYGMMPPIDDEGAKGLGTASMVLGICSLALHIFGMGFYGVCTVITMIASIVGVSLGGVSLARYKRTGASNGKGMAVAGVILNSINIGLAVLIILVIVVVVLIIGFSEF